MYLDGYDQIRCLHQELNSIKTQFFILRYYVHSGPTTEFMFLHRLTCVVLYHVKDWRCFKIQMKGFLRYFMKRNLYAQSFLSVYGFIFYTIPHMLTVPYKSQQPEKVPFCEELRTKVQVIPPLQL